MEQLTEQLLSILVAVGGILLFIVMAGMILVLFKKKTESRNYDPDHNKYPESDKYYTYKKKVALFSHAENSFYRVICQAVTNQLIVFGKVRVADIIEPEAGAYDRRHWQSAFNKINAKHFDYVLCHPQTLAVLAVVELDDQSHKKKRRINRDQLLDRACQSAGLKLYRFNVRPTYSISAVKNTFSELLENTSGLSSK